MSSYLLDWLGIKCPFCYWVHSHYSETDMRKWGCSLARVLVSLFTKKQAMNSHHQTCFMSWFSECKRILPFCLLLNYVHLCHLYCLFSNGFSVVKQWILDSYAFLSIALSSWVRFFGRSPDTFCQRDLWDWGFLRCCNIGRCWSLSLEFSFLVP